MLHIWRIGFNFNWFFQTLAKLIYWWPNCGSFQWAVDGLIWWLSYSGKLKNNYQYVVPLSDNLLGDCSVSKVIYLWLLFTPQPSGLEGYCRHGPGGRAGGCQTCGTHISVTAWRIFSIRSSVELSRPLVVHCYGHLPICPIWACPWAKNLSNLPQIGSRLCGSQISETAGWMYPI